MRSRLAAGAVLGVLAATVALLDVVVGITGVRLTPGGFGECRDYLPACEGGHPYVHLVRAYVRTPTDSARYVRTPTDSARYVGTPTDDMRIRPDAH
ncbi:hypothetical protein Stsp02_00350 [Streptomyces sp. NBRC 14336]|nr:hypothetical protein Stsp02_00350 [Streptomyces sp. NBRC 14336]